MNRPRAEVRWQVEKLAALWAAETTPWIRTAEMTDPLHDGFRWLPDGIPGGPSGPHPKGTEDGYGQTSPWAFAAADGDDDLEDDEEEEEEDDFDDEEEDDLDEEEDFDDEDLEELDEGIEDFEDVDEDEDEFDDDDDEEEDVEAPDDEAEKPAEFEEEEFGGDE